MKSEVMMWSVTEGSLTKVELPRFADTHKEKDLEEWVEHEPSLLGRPLKIIGRQVYIPKVGPIDLLAVDESGRLVVIEFKRQQTTRDTIAQSLDYSSSIRRMDPQALLGLSNIKIEEVNEIVDFDPMMILVAAEADEATDRIVDYLASKAELPIETVNFTYATLQSGQEILVRIVTTPDAPLSTGTGGVQSASSIAKLAEDRDASVIFDLLRSVKTLDWREQALKTGGGSLRYWVKTPEGDRVVFSMNVGGARWNTPKGALDLKFWPEVIANSSDLSVADVWTQLGKFPVLKQSKQTIWLRISSEHSAQALLTFLSDWEVARIKSDDN